MAKRNFNIDPYCNGLEKSRDDEDDILDEVLERPAFQLERDVKTNEVVERQHHLSTPVTTVVEIRQHNSLPGNTSTSM